MSRNLQHIVQDALSAVHSHPHHDLNLGYRQAIWNAYGSHNDEPATTKQTIAHQNRTRLAILTARSVLSIWDCTWQNNRTPHHLLRIAEHLIQRMDRADTARDEGETFLTWLESAMVLYEYKPPLYAGFSAVKALFVAVEDEKFDSGAIDYQCTDADIDPYDLDTSFFACAAYAHGSVWESESDAAKRRDFWEWWLKHAVPKAQSAVVTYDC